MNYNEFITRFNTFGLFILALDAGNWDRMHLQGKIVQFFFSLLKCAWYRQLAPSIENSSVHAPGRSVLLQKSKKTTVILIKLLISLSSQLYRTASFNSSGRSSNCDNTEDMYSDEDVQDLNHKVSK